ncbi:MAG TPA: histone deacetylase, partial [Candidatus Aenigmarchaeota archaeon]|nr:histone deacetylase [Candidatus Aenigmarchaeota archaeon]
MKILFDKRCMEYWMEGHYESPQRVKIVYSYLKEKGFAFIKPKI